MVGQGDADCGRGMSSMMGFLGVVSWIVAVLAVIMNWRHVSL